MANAQHPTTGASGQSRGQPQMNTDFYGSTIGKPGDQEFSETVFENLNPNFHFLLQLLTR